MAAMRAFFVREAPEPRRASIGLSVRIEHPASGGQWEAARERASLAP